MHARPTEGLTKCPGAKYLGNKQTKNVLCLEIRTHNIGTALLLQHLTALHKSLAAQQRDATFNPTSPLPPQARAKEINWNTNQINVQKEAKLTPTETCLYLAAADNTAQNTPGCETILCPEPATQPFQAPGPREKNQSGASARSRSTDGARRPD